MNILFEQEVCEYLDIPSIPKTKWDGKTTFKSGVAVLSLAFGNQRAYATCAFNAERDKKPRVTHVFSAHTFKRIDEIYVVPAYMDVDIESFDISEESKKAATQVLEEAKELEQTHIEDVSVGASGKYYFQEITSLEEAQAFIHAYDKEHGNKEAKMLTSEDEILTRLAVIWRSEENKKRKRTTKTRKQRRK